MADTYYVVTIFESGRSEHIVVFACFFYEMLITVPNGFFSRLRLKNTLENIENKNYSYSGVCDDLK